MRGPRGGSAFNPRQAPLLGGKVSPNLQMKELCPITSSCTQAWGGGG